MGDISFNNACKELKIAQIAQFNQLFQLLHLVHKQPRLLWVTGKSYANEEKCKQWCQQSFAYSSTKHRFYYSLIVFHSVLSPLLIIPMVKQIRQLICGRPIQLVWVGHHSIPLQFLYFFLIYRGKGIAREGWGRDYHIKVTGMLVVSRTDVNYRLWSHLECLGWKVTVFAHSGIA